MRHLRWASVLVCVGLVYACGTINGQQADTEKQTQVPASLEALAMGAGVHIVPIVLVEDSSGKCTKMDPIPLIHALGGHTLKWFIYNACKAPVKIQLANFTMQTIDRTPFDPFSMLRDSCTAEPEHLCWPMPMAVIKLAGPEPHVVRLFTYDILNGGTPIEPEIVIEWP